MLKNRVKLTDYEIFFAASVGNTRRIKEGCGAKYHHGVGNDWSTDVEAACAEMAAAKFLNIFWSPSVGTYKAPDIGKFQVRHTTLENGSLIVRPRDDNEEKYILVIGTAPNYYIMGWFYGKDAKKDEYLRNPNKMRPAWFVPQNELKLMEDIGIISPKEEPCLK